MRRLVFALIFFQFSQLFAQSGDSTKISVSGSFSTSPYAACIAMNHTFLNDYFLGFGSGIYANNRNWSAKLNFDFRPYFDNITFKENDTLNSQYKERDYFLSISIEKLFPLKRNYPMLLPFVELKGGLLWGNFKGWDKSPESKYKLAPSGGLVLGVNEMFHFKLGYQYFTPLVKNTAPHRIYFQMNLIINN